MRCVFSISPQRRASDAVFFLEISKIGVGGTSFFDDFINFSLAKLRFRGFEMS